MFRTLTAEWKLVGLQFPERVLCWAITTSRLIVSKGCATSARGMILCANGLFAAFDFLVSLERVLVGRIGLELGQVQMGLCAFLTGVFESLIAFFFVKVVERSGHRLPQRWCSECQC
jgi:hypothetical protein